MAVKNLHFFVLIALFISSASLAQGDRKDKNPVTYEELYDEPYSINKLFVQFQPLYGEMFTTNVNAGFGLEASYYLKEKADFKAQFRTTYGASFYDLGRKQADNNTYGIENDPVTLTYFEIGGTYHVKDFEGTSKTKMVLYKKSYAGNKWAARVPLSAEVPCKIRKIYGARLGAISWKSTIDMNRVMDEQGLTAADFKDSEGNVLSDAAGADVKMFSNVSATGLYLGGSMSWIRNVAVSFDKFESGVDDLILTTYLDLLYSPSLSVDDIVFTERDNNDNIIATRTYSSSPVGLSKFGFRAGVEGKFNRMLGWGYGGEVGMRPSVQGKMFYAMLKISFPVFGTNLDYKVESFGK
jgi:hypothetical protein